MLSARTHIAGLVAAAALAIVPAVAAHGTREAPAAVAAKRWLLAPPLAAQSSGRLSFADAVGDATLDIHSVTVARNAGGGITFAAQLGQKTLRKFDQFQGQPEGVQLVIDSDNNAATGSPPGAWTGAEFLLYLDWYGLQATRAPEYTEARMPSAYAYVIDGSARFAMNRRDLNMTSDRLRFRIESAFGDQGEPSYSEDAAPSRPEMVDYELSTAPLVLRVVKFRRLARRVRVGKRFGVRMQAHRSDLDELTSAESVRCSAKVGRRGVPRLRAGFAGNVATCTGIAPSFARGRRLKVRATIALDGKKVSRRTSIAVRRR